MRMLKLIQKNWRYYLQLMRTDKPIGTLLLLWPTYWALWLAADGFPQWHLLLIFSLGVFVMRSAGCVINDFADRKVDGKVKRTEQRPLAAGHVSAKEALVLFFVLIFAAFLLVLCLNLNTVLLSFAALGLAFCYPFMKRYTHLPQVVLGAAFSWSIPMAYMATLNTIPTEAWLLYGANLVWTVAYDTMYGMVDRDDDLKIGVKSTAILFGRFDKLIVSLLQLATILMLLFIASLHAWSYGLFVILSLVLVVLFSYQQYLIRDRQRELCFKAFLHNNYVGIAVWLAIVVSYS
ncbi:4-hydroxybenzoate octaprenyltransferase [Pseudoalteromonas ulvae]|uniref:4-hydroxybenzoate octaprenyltransferase n=1 Tax=Pseudoalteromonas ulvae TaxID=107327 RepID=A0A244CQ49_PSEDV|nr:4-hydroxybenzoate octaprenyltransferase [Pseudoalteromonas ulvae]OUL57722.1 4-hydroxybenzoate polyprenyltransferase [Pseudoalteromonas ulvae]